MGWPALTISLTFEEKVFWEVPFLSGILLGSLGWFAFMECAGDEVGAEVEELVEVEFVAELEEFNCLAARHIGIDFGF